MDKYYEVWTTYNPVMNKGWKRIHLTSDKEKAKRLAISWVYEFGARASEVREVEGKRNEQIFFFG